MPPKKSPAEALAASLKRLKLTVPADFVVDAASGEHENLQRLFACGLNTPDTFDAEVGPFKLRGILIQPNFVRQATADGRTWRELARHADVEVAIGIFDEGAEDPQVFRANVDEGWDDRNNVPLPGHARPLGTLSQFVAKVKRRVADKPTDAVPAELLPLAWNAPMELRSFTPVRVGGPAVLGRVREPRREGVEDAALNEGVGLFHADGRIECVALRATHSNYLGACAWAGESGESIVTLGLRRNRLTHVGMLERAGDTWTARELWGIDPAAPEAMRSSSPALAATAESFAYTTMAAADGADELVHAWHRRAGIWQPVGSLPMGQSIRLFAGGPERIRCSSYLGGRVALTELVIDAGGVRPGEVWPMPEPQAVDQDRCIVNTMYQGGISVFERGAEVQRIKTPKVHGLLVARAGCIVAVTVPEDRRRPSQLLGFRHNGKAYARWFERSGANLIDHRGGCDQPGELALTGNTLYLGFGHLGVRRVELP